MLKSSAKSKNKNRPPSVKHLRWLTFVKKWMPEPRFNAKIKMFAKTKRSLLSAATKNKKRSTYKLNPNTYLR